MTMIGLYNGLLVADARTVQRTLGDTQYRQLNLAGRIVPIIGRSGLINLIASDSIVLTKLMGAAAVANKLETDTIYPLNLSKQ